MDAMLPPLAMSWFRTDGLHRPISIRSVNRCGFTTINSPALTLRAYRLLV